LLTHKLRFGTGQGYLEHAAIRMFLEGNGIEPGDIECMPTIAAQAAAQAVAWRVVTDATDLAADYPPGAGALAWIAHQGETRRTGGRSTGGGAGRPESPLVAPDPGGLEWALQPSPPHHDAGAILAKGVP
jgi:hypothetical protein